MNTVKSIFSFLKQHGWIIWVNICIAEYGLYIEDIRYWILIIPLIMLKELSDRQRIKLARKILVNQLIFRD